MKANQSHGYENHSYYLLGRSSKQGVHYITKPKEFSFSGGKIKNHRFADEPFDPPATFSEKPLNRLEKLSDR